MDHLVQCSAGLDVHRDIVVASVRHRVGAREPVETRTFGTFPDELRDLAQWLHDSGVQLVVMESTGVYFKPVFRELQRKQLTTWVVNAAHVKQVPGRKSDVSDSVWLSKLGMHGLVAPSFIPDEILDGLRMLTRLRVQTVHELTRQKNRLLKLLESFGIKLASICSDVLGASGRAFLRALLDGKLSADQMAQLAKGRLRAKRALLQRVLGVRLGDEAKWMLSELLHTFEQTELRIERLDRRIAQSIQCYSPDVEVLRQIPSLDSVSIAAVLAETGPDMSVFATGQHITSWAGLAPGKNETAGKCKPTPVRRGNPWLSSILVQIAWVASRTKRSPWRATFARLARTTGSAKKAAVAVARRILLAVYHTLRTRKFQPTCPPPPSDAQRQRRAKRAVEILQELGFRVSLTHPASEQAASPT